MSPGAIMCAHVIDNLGNSTYTILNVHTNFDVSVQQWDCWLQMGQELDHDCESTV